MVKENENDTPPGKEQAPASPLEEKKDTGKSVKKGPTSPPYSSRKPKPRESAGAEEKGKDKNRRPSSRKKGDASRKNRKSSKKSTKKRRSKSVKKGSRGKQERHRHHHSKKKKKPQEGRSPNNAKDPGQISPPIKIGPIAPGPPSPPLPEGGKGDPPGPGEGKTPPLPEDGGTILIAPADYKVSLAALFC